jgi:hypothetical protein
MYFVLDLDWDEFKTEVIAKGYPLNHKTNNSGGYEVFAIDRSSLIWRAVINDSDDVTEFETYYKSKSNMCIYDTQGKEFTRAESRPLDMATWFTGAGDNIDAGTIGDGKDLQWDFSTSEDLIVEDSNIKRKRLEFQFIDSICIKEGAIYFENALFGSYVDLKVVCPAGNYYYKNDGTPAYAFVDTVVDHFVNHQHIMGTCYMGDELNTEAASMEIPPSYKYFVEITVPNTDSTSRGHISMELYRRRSVVLE